MKILRAPWLLVLAPMCCWRAGAAPEKPRWLSFHTWFGINSAPEHFEHRRVIRDTWKQHPWARAAKFQFVVGFSGNSTLDGLVDDEGSRYGDVLRVSLLDTYRNLTLKTALLLQAGARSGADWVVKADDDVVPRMDSIVDSLAKAGPVGHSELRYAGQFWMGNRVNRNASDGKYFVPTTAFAGDTFPKYANGPLYAVSHGLAKEIAVDNFAQFFNNPIPLEDAQVGTAVAWVADHKPVDYVDLHLAMSKEGGVLVHGCNKGMWSQYYHGIPPDEMRCMWKRMQQRPPVDVCCFSGVMDELSDVLERGAKRLRQSRLEP